MNTYSIQDIRQLDDGANALANYNQAILNSAQNLAYITNLLKGAWQNDEGQDLESILTEIDTCTKELNDNIVPTIRSFVTTVRTISENTKRDQSRTINF